MQEKQYKIIFRCVQIAVVAVFLGRAWQHLYWGAPYRVLLWNEAWMSWIVEGVFQYDWDTYVTSPVTDRNISLLTRIVGVFYVCCALVAAFVRQLPHSFRVFLPLGSLSLMFLASLYFQEKFFHLGQFWEYTLQWASPLFLYALLRKGSLQARLVFWMKVAIALTFTCHGLYAIGYYPRPVAFLEMSMNCLSLNEAQSVRFLQIAGILDFVISLALFLPRNIAILAAIYATIWGFFTSLARLWAYLYIDFLSEGFLTWTHETVFRFPHFLIPFAVFWWLYKRKSLY
jgi:hypothetical protein